jgi:hypothetical protein
MVSYLKVYWHHDLPDEPVELYSELDDDRWEIRKIEIFRDGRCELADQAQLTGALTIGEAPIPLFEEIAEQVEFSPFLIDASEFETVWQRAVAEN